MKEYGKECTEFKLYEDDYETFSYETGKMSEVILQRDTEGNITYRREGTGKERYRILL